MKVVPSPALLSTPNLAAVQAHQFLHQSKTDARALVSAAALTLDAMESFEHARQLRFGNADTAVFHNEHGVGTVDWTAPRSRRPT